MTALEQLLLPYDQVRDFLPKPELDALLAYVLANSGKFKPAKIWSGEDDVIRPNVRIALTCRNFGALKKPLEGRFSEALPMIMERTGASGRAPDKIEFELAAHGDGAFYDRHIDLLENDAEKRVLSCVLYFHAEPKGFTGGQLRLYRLGPDPEFIDLEPLQNSLVMFHSWVPHEVRPVSVPSGAFRDYRFALNCWYTRTLNA